MSQQQTTKYECELCTAIFYYAGELPPEQPKVCQTCKYALGVEGANLERFL